MSLLARYQTRLLITAAIALTVFALVAMPSTVVAQTPTATATAAAPAKAATPAVAPAKTGNAGLGSTTSTTTALMLGFVVVAGGLTLLARRSTRS